MTLVDEPVVADSTDLWAELLATGATIQESYYSFVSEVGEESERERCVIEVCPSGYRLLRPAVIRYTHSRRHAVDLLGVALWPSADTTELLAMLPFSQPAHMHRGETLEVSFQSLQAQGWKV